ncbi:MAG: hypothetical protein J3Q66DRAFT_407391 [Benniella sp.]|nr:MAG: hypothetical protein J3Q66DRAFT_407391 [Benniella sp.]
MDQYIFSTLLTTLVHTAILLLISPLAPSVNAQNFRPSPAIEPCSAFVEGQALYVVGGGNSKGTTSSQAFMLDLSVSWSTSDPVFRKLRDGPAVSHLPCTMSSNGEDLYMFVQGVGHIYNVKSNSWTVGQKTSFIGHGRAAAADPETGLIYVMDGAMDSAGKRVMMSVDLKTGGTISTTAVPDLKMSLFTTGAWCAPLKSMLVVSMSYHEVYAFTPGKVNGQSYGWSALSTVGDVVLSSYSPCFVPAYGGSKMVLFSGDSKQSAAYILDVSTMTWKKSSFVPMMGGNACAVSGDQFIVWGSVGDNAATYTTLVYDMKSDAWTSNYVASQLSSTTMLPTSIQDTDTSRTITTPSTTTTPNAIATPGLDNNPSNDSKPITIIVVAASILLLIVLTAVVMYLRRSKRLKLGTSSSDSTSSDGLASPSGLTGSNASIGSNVLSTDRLEVKGGIDFSDEELSNATTLQFYPGLESTKAYPDPSTKHKLHVSASIGRIQQGVYGARPLSIHPHAVVEPITKRSVQVGAFGARPLSQHPHAIVEEMITTYHNDKAELE